VKTVQSFAFRDGAKYGLVLFNLDLDSARAIEIHIPVAPKPNAMMHRIAPPSIHSDNEDSVGVEIVTTEVNDFRDGYQMMLPPHSAQAITWQSAEVTSVKPDAILDRASLDISSPASSGAVITYHIPTPGTMRLELLDLMGRTVKVLAERYAAPGAGVVHLDGELASGCYFLRLATERGADVKKIVVIR